MHRKICRFNSGVRLLDRCLPKLDRSDSKIPLNAKLLQLRRRLIYARGTPGLQTIARLSIHVPTLFAIEALGSQLGLR